MADIDEKLESMLSLIKREKDENFKELQDDYKSKLKEYEEKVSKELEKIREEKLNEAKAKAENIIEVAKTKADFILKQENVKNRNEFITSFFNKLKEEMFHLDSKDKLYLYRKLYRDASKMTDDEFVVLCNPKDVEIVKSIAKDAKVKPDSNIEGGIILQSGELKVWNTLDSYLQEKKSEILNLLAKEVGEL
jgi:vacuolar-type H+-ATPase subunit E/Vma4